MKKLLIFFAFFFGFLIPANADVMPYYISNIDTSSIGVYQASNNIRIYKEPNEKSTVLLDVYWDSKTYNSPSVAASNLFAVFLPKKDLAFLIVTDESEDWVEVVYNRNGSQRGWLKKDDQYKYLNWRTFYSLYGRKYGLYYLKDAPEFTRDIYGSNVDDSQIIGRVTLAQTIKLTSVKGNWVLASVFDIDKIQKIGWIKWRNTNGEIYMFPDIK